MTIIEFVIVFFIAAGATGLTLFLTIKHQKDVDKVKVGDKVYFGGSESEVLEVNENTVVIKSTVNKMRINLKK